MGGNQSKNTLVKNFKKEPILAKEPEEIPPSYVPIYPPLPPAPSSTPPLPTLDGEV
jgi:hypothetical protein